MKGKEEGKIVGMYQQSVKRSNGVSTGLIFMNHSLGTWQWTD